MSPRPSRFESLAPCHLLVCEDNESNLILIQTIVASFGCTTSTARNGQEAIERCQDSHYDAILMDLAMPLMSGLEAAKHIRVNESPNLKTPIIAVTAEVSPLAQRASISFGINEYISKPIDADLLHDTIQKLIA
ncbi:response regulator [Coraliomargarita sp. W4R53]